MIPTEREAEDERKFQHALTTVAAVATGVVVAFLMLIALLR